MSSIQGLPTAKPEEVGLSSEQLARICPVMQKYIEREVAPGFVTLVARHGRIAHLGAQGMMDMANKKPIVEDAIFKMYSMTKPVTAVAAMILYEDGRFLLDDPVSKFLPVFKNLRVMAPEAPLGKLRPWPPGLVFTVPANREITIRDLLTHTSGLATSRRTPIALLLTGYAEAIRGTKVMLPEDVRTIPSQTTRERMESLARIPLHSQPGTHWEYGLDLSVMGVIIEVISGKTLDEFFEERIFEPLGMEDSSFYLPEKKVSRFVTEYLIMPQAQGWKLQVRDRPESSHKLKGPKIHFDGAGFLGGVLSTASDYARFAQMLLNGGELDGVRILSRKTVELMTTNHVGDLVNYLMGHDYGWGFGVGVRRDVTMTPAIGSVGEYGWGGAACTHYFASPKDDVLGLIFTQVLGGWGVPGFYFDRDFAQIVYQAIRD